jgi:hypothetical protein
MSKLLNIVKYLLLIFIIILNFISVKNTSIYSWWNILYLFLIIIFTFLSIKDLIKKNGINKNKTYNILCILVFLITSFILLRALCDPRFIYNNQAFMTELKNYNLDLYGFNSYSDEQQYIAFYLVQNMSYFIIMMGLLFVYRFINKDKMITEK